MKVKSIVFPFFLSATAFILTNCGSKKEAHNHEETEQADTSKHVSSTTGYAEAAEPQFAVEANFQKQLADVFTAYVSLKDAFVASDASTVKAQSASAQAALGKVDMKLLSGVAHNDWMNYLSGLKSSLQAMQASDDIEVQRKAFSDLSDNLYKTIKAYGLGGTNAYYEFCPMAFDNQGAFWLSSEDKIRNPYFGDKMLTCGEVKEKLK
jgi:hypothetical protein